MVSPFFTEEPSFFLIDCTLTSLEKETVWVAADATEPLPSTVFLIVPFVAF